MPAKIATASTTASRAEVKIKPLTSGLFVGKDTGNDIIAELGGIAGVVNENAALLDSVSSKVKNLDTTPADPGPAPLPQKTINICMNGVAGTMLVNAGDFVPL